jgi:hypothetical protein
MHHAIRMGLCLLVAVGLLTSSVRASQPVGVQPAPGVGPAVPLHVPSDALDIGPMTITADLSYLSGQVVRMANVRVHDVISPRLFAIEPAGVPTGRIWWWNNRVLVVVGSPLPETSLRRGAIVEVVGQAWTLFEAQLQPDQAALGDLGRKEARHFGEKPVIRASLVRTPGGIELYTAR